MGFQAALQAYNPFFDKELNDLQGTDDNANPRISSRSRGSEEPHIGKYRLIKTIGKGNFAKVKLAKHVPTGREVRVQYCCSTPDYVILNIQYYTDY